MPVTSTTIRPVIVPTKVDEEDDNIKPAVPGVAHGNCPPIFPRGTTVEYQSKTHKKWITGKVLSFDAERNFYQLDVQPKAARERVRGLGGKSGGDDFYGPAGKDLPPKTTSPVIIDGATVFYPNVKRQASFSSVPSKMNSQSSSPVEMATTATSFQPFSPVETIDPAVAVGNGSSGLPTPTSPGNQPEQAAEQAGLVLVAAAAESGESGLVAVHDKLSGGEAKHLSVVEKPDLQVDEKEIVGKEQMSQELHAMVEQEDENNKTMLDTILPPQDQDQQEEEENHFHGKFVSPALEDDHLVNLAVIIPEEEETTGVDIDTFESWQPVVDIFETKFIWTKSSTGTMMASSSSSSLSSTPSKVVITTTSCSKSKSKDEAQDDDESDSEGPQVELLQQNSRDPAVYSSEDNLTEVLRWKEKCELLENEIFEKDNIINYQREELKMQSEELKFKDELVAFLENKCQELAAEEEVLKGNNDDDRSKNASVFSTTDGEQKSGGDGDDNAKQVAGTTGRFGLLAMIRRVLPCKAEDEDSL
ncbi:unnamed protein product [Amoebophrya sp. A120]|nr:unnamed protein product [Amoebophrya sp. A120]|eukprot:GSA120T00013124001.1